jgi:hypothetical protein
MSEHRHAAIVERAQNDDRLAKGSSRAFTVEDDADEAAVIDDYTDIDGVDTTVRGRGSDRVETVIELNRQFEFEDDQMIGN